MRRGDIVTVSAAGDYGKPRPAVVVQSDYLTDADLASVIVCLISGRLQEAPAFRLDVDPTHGNGLRKPSQIMIDKVATVRRSRIGKLIGHLDDESTLRLNRLLAFAMGLAD